MTKSADPDQLASEANWSGSTLYAKAEYIRVQQDKDETTSEKESMHKEKNLLLRSELIFLLRNTLCQEIKWFWHCVIFYKIHLFFIRWKLLVNPAKYPAEPGHSIFYKIACPPGIDSDQMAWK